MSYGIRKDFYNSKAWKTTRRNVWLKQSCTCYICHRPVYVDGISPYIEKDKRRTGIVHHIKELDNDNVYDDTIALNEENLIGVCKDCHESLHHQDKAIRSDYRFDENGQIIPGGPVGLKRL